MGGWVVRWLGGWVLEETVSGVVQWRQRELIEAVKTRVAADMEIAVKLVEVDARQRLRDISEPRFGRAYRRILALFRLKSGVTVEEKAVIGWVGIPRGEKGGDYGFWIEVGSRAMAAQPWLRPALIQNVKKITRILGGK